MQGPLQSAETITTSRNTTLAVLLLLPKLPSTTVMLSLRQCAPAPYLSWQLNSVCRWFDVLCPGYIQHSMRVIEWVSEWASNSIARHGGGGYGRVVFEQHEPSSPSFIHSVVDAMSTVHIYLCIRPSIQSCCCCCCYFWWTVYTLIICSMNNYIACSVSVAGSCRVSTDDHHKRSSSSLEARIADRLYVLAQHNLHQIDRYIQQTMEQDFRMFSIRMNI